MHLARLEDLLDVDHHMARHPGDHVAHRVPARPVWVRPVKEDVLRAKRRNLHLAQSEPLLVSVCTLGIARTKRPDAGKAPARNDNATALPASGKAIVLDDPADRNSWAMRHLIDNLRYAWYP
jgi:hypothetical protein